MKSPVQQIDENKNVQEIKNRPKTAVRVGHQKS
jgi:hypothetical protein